MLVCAIFVMNVYVRRFLGLRDVQVAVPILWLSRGGPGVLLHQRTCALQHSASGSLADNFGLAHCSGIVDYAFSTCV